MKRRRRKRRSIFGKFIILMLLLVVLIVSVFTGVGWIKYKRATAAISVDDAIERIRSQNNYTFIDDMPLTFVNAMVAVEDKRFYEHNGYDVFGIFRALTNNLKQKSFTEGGSCITQQLAKNIYFMNDNTLSRKVAEIFVAIELEKKLTKKEILELYFNVIYYGSGYYNIYDASKGYFNKEPRNLTDYESTILAGIPNAPSVYSLKKNSDLAKKRQVKVVNSMVETGYLTREEANAILAKQ